MTELILAILIRSLLYQPFNIPSAAMRPNLVPGDYLFVAKFAYGYSRYSVPFVPFPRRDAAPTPERGDVIVFKLPSDGQTDYVKRVVGLPGDTIQMKGGVLYINGVAVKVQRVEPALIRDASGRMTPVTQYRETLPGGRSYVTTKLTANGYLDNTDVFTVPARHLFVIGDNRDNSTDSRVPEESNGVGYVPFENLEGRASFIFFSIEPWEGANPPPDAGRIRWERIGTVIE